MSLLSPFNPPPPPGYGASNKLGKDNNPRIPVNANLLSYGKKGGSGQLIARGSPFFSNSRKVQQGNHIPPYANPSTALLPNKYYRRLMLINNLIVGQNMANRNKQVKK